MRRMREQHLRDNPDCPYGDEPHYVPPGAGTVGFYACQPLDDITNHDRQSLNVGPEKMAADQSSLYRLSWEMVDQRELWRYCNADPNYYKNTTQTVPNSQIPDEHWHPLSKMTDNPWQQFNTLHQWASEDRKFVRNVRLEAMSIITYTEALGEFPMTCHRCHMEADS